MSLLSPVRLLQQAACITDSKRSYSFLGMSRLVMVDGSEFDLRDFLISL